MRQEVKCEAMQTGGGVAKHTSQIALLNCFLATCFATGKKKFIVTYNLLEVYKLQKISLRIRYIPTIPAVCAVSRVSIIQLRAAVLST